MIARKPTIAAALSPAQVLQTEQRLPIRYLCLAGGRLICSFSQRNNGLTPRPWLPILLIMALLGGLLAAAARGSGLEPLIYTVF